VLLYYLSVIESGYHEGKWCKKYEENKEVRDCCYRLQKRAKLCLFGVIMMRFGRQIFILYDAFLFLISRSFEAVQLLRPISFIGGINLLLT
jgi:hypothetical protein